MYLHSVGVGTVDIVLCRLGNFFIGKHMKLSLETEEVATFYGRMLDHDYTTKEVFNKNFFKDWKKVGINSSSNIFDIYFTIWIFSLTYGVMLSELISCGFSPWSIKLKTFKKNSEPLSKED